MTILERLRKTLYYFLFFLTVNLLGDYFFKDELNLTTAFSVAIGVSIGIVYLGPVIFNLFNKKSESNH